VKGASQLRRKLSKIEPSMRLELQQVLRDGGFDIRDLARALAPRDEGVIRENIDSAVFSKGMQLKVGYITKRARRFAWYAHFVHWGTRGGTFPAKRRNAASRHFASIGQTKKSYSVSTRYTVTMPPKPARPFLQQAADILLPRVRAEAREALKRVVYGAARRAVGLRG
jgi:HK97 gp10 family phage protein